MIYLISVLSIISIVSIYFCIKLGILILNVQDTLEEALDVIDEKYASITNICERPLFYDSPEVKKVLNDIKDTRNALHKIAISLSSNFEIIEDTTEEES